MKVKTSRKRIAVFPGSFDPVTRGHLDIVERGSELFDGLVVGVLVNPEKSPLLSEEERVALIRREVARNGKVKVVTFRGLLVQLAARVGARWILRGIRSGADLHWELPMALSNRLCGRTVVETVLLPSRPEFQFISSRLVREIGRHGGNLAPFVTPAVARALEKKFREMDGRREK